MTKENVFVFKTSVNLNKEAKKLAPILNKLVDSSGKWNFDLEDCDHILRVECQQLSAKTIAAAVQAKGFYCEELEY